MPPSQVRKAEQDCLAATNRCLASTGCRPSVSRLSYIGSLRKIDEMMSGRLLEGGVMATRSSHRTIGTFLKSKHPFDWRALDPLILIDLIESEF